MHSQFRPLRCFACIFVTGMNLVYLFLWYVYNFMTTSPLYGGILVTILILLTTWSYNITAFTDPGTPRSPEWLAFTAGIDPESSAKHTLGRGWHAGEMDRCNRCRTSRPERAHHCKRCMQCVLRMDHHCMWTGNCIGWRNHKPFILTAWWGFAATSVAIVTAQKPSLVDFFAYFRSGAQLIITDDPDHTAWAVTGGVLAILLNVFCGILLYQDLRNARLNVSRIEAKIKVASPYRLPKWSDNLQQLMGVLDWRALLPIPPTGQGSDGTTYPVADKQM